MTGFELKDVPHISEKLIVWTEPDETDFALSFQDVDGCTETWNFILEFQKYLRGKV